MKKLILILFISSLVYGVEKPYIITDTKNPVPIEENFREIFENAVGKNDVNGTKVSACLISPMPVPALTEKCVAFNSKTFDFLNEFSLISSSFTASISGYYFIIAQVGWQNTATGKAYYLYIMKNNTYISQCVGIGGLNFLTLNTTILVNLSAGDKIAAHVYNGDNTENIHGENSGIFSYLNIFRVF